MDVARLVAPADKRLEADHLAASDIDFRLERAAELAVADGQPQPLLQLHARRHGPAERQIEEGGRSLGAALDVVDGARSRRRIAVR